MKKKSKLTLVLVKTILRGNAKPQKAPNPPTWATKVTQAKKYHEP